MTKLGRRRFLKGVGIAVAAPSLLGLIGPRVMAAAHRPGRKVKIGMLTDLTGQVAPLGTGQVEGARIALDEVNALMRESAGNPSFSLLVKDTKYPDNAALLRAFNKLKNAGVQAIVGPLSSWEAERIVSLANDNQIVLVSPSSTSPALVQNDFLFRVAPPDGTLDVNALARTLMARGRTHAVVVEVPEGFYNPDYFAYYNADYFVASYQGLGGAVESRVEFDLGQVETAVQAAVDDIDIDADSVAVVSFSFGEVVDLFEQILVGSVLEDVEWYGRYLDDRLLETDAAERIPLVNVTVSWPPTERFTEFAAEFQARTGGEPAAFGGPWAYDAFWLVALTVLSAKKYEGEALRRHLPRLAESMYGATGWLRLDDVGDRDQPDFGVFAAQPDGSSQLYWQRVATFSYPYDAYIPS